MPVLMAVHMVLAVVPSFPPDVDADVFFFTINAFAIGVFRLLVMPASSSSVIGLSNLPVRGFG